MRERLQKIISSAGFASRRAAEDMIRAGRITVNGVTASIGDGADPELDVIAIDGTEISAPEKKIYIMLNKPAGYVTTMSDDMGRKTAAELVEDAGTRLYPVGRLDMYSEGLLIFTNDGDVANRLMHPSHHVLKTYVAQVFGADIKSAAAKLRGKMIIDEVEVKAARVEVAEINGTSGELEITIGEGRNRQVRRMCTQANLRVNRLIRVSQGEIRLGDLPSGEWRHLTDEETAYLQSLG